MKNSRYILSIGALFLCSFNLFAGDFTLSYGAANKKSPYHKTIEDHCCFISLAPYFNSNRQCKTDTFFGVFDGHGSKEENDGVSDLLAKQLPILIVGKLSSNKNLEHIRENIYDSVIQLDNYSRVLIDQGSTAVFCLLLEDKLLVTNIGDSRAVIYKQNVLSEDFYATEDNKPEKSIERIEAEGGKVENIKGVPRVGGVYAVSRSIGDYTTDILHGEAKIKGMTCSPETTEFILDSSYKFIILASDGLWDVISNDTAVNFVKEQLELGKNPNDISSNLIKRAHRSHDDITVLIVTFEWSFMEHVKDSVKSVLNIFKQ